MEDYEANYFDFSLTQTNLPYITAVGSGPAFAYHKSKALSTLRLFAETTCVCAAAPPVFGDTASATLTYDATGTVNSKNSTIGFGKACMGECAAGDKSCTKSSSMIEQRNPTCDVRYCECSNGRLGIRLLPRSDATVAGNRSRRAGLLPPPVLPARQEPEPPGAERRRALLPDEGPLLLPGEPPLNSRVASARHRSL